MNDLVENVKAAVREANKVPALEQRIAELEQFVAAYDDWRKAEPNANWKQDQIMSEKRKAIDAAIGKPEEVRK